MVNEQRSQSLIITIFFRKLTINEEENVKIGSILSLLAFLALALATFAVCYFNRKGRYDFRKARKVRNRLRRFAHARHSLKLRFDSAFTQLQNSQFAIFKS